MFRYPIEMNEATKKLMAEVQEWTKIQGETATAITKTAFGSQQFKELWALFEKSAEKISAAWTELAKYQIKGE